MTILKRTTSLGLPSRSSTEYCGTCATALNTTSALPSSLDDKNKPTSQNRRVECCGRIICGKCIQGNSRFATYCPYCQVSDTPTSLPQRLKDPPLYTSVPNSSSKTTQTVSGAPPPYTPNWTAEHKDMDDEKAAGINEEKHLNNDTLHFLNHEHDTIASLSLRYGVPAMALRRANNITSDHLLLGRRTVLIPGEFYKGGISLSPRPIEGEEEERRKAKIRRFMTACKVSDYDVALLYLEQSGYDLDIAVDVYFDDEKWEREHPLRNGLRKKRKNYGLFS